MPSASTNRPMSASTPIVSSLCSRTRPTSVRPTERILPRTSWPPVVRSRDQPLVLGLIGLRGVLWAGARAQRARQLAAVGIAVVGRLGERARQDRIYALGQPGAHQAYGGVGLGGDLLHQPRHRLGAKRQLSAEQLIEADAEGELVGASVEGSTFQLFRRHE